MRQIELEKAREIAGAVVAQRSKEAGIELALIETSTARFELGWVFAYQSREFVESGDVMTAVGGNGPILVLDPAGRVLQLGTGTPTEAQLGRLVASATAAEEWACVWNTVHDGSIISATMEQGTLTVDVEVLYLAERIDPQHTSIRLVFPGCTRFAYRPWEGGWHDDLDEIVSLEPEILSVSSFVPPVRVVCVEGELEMAAEGVRVLTQSDEELGVDGLEAVARAYWG